MKNFIINMFDWIFYQYNLFSRLQYCFCQSKTRPVAREKRAHFGLIRKVSRVENAPI